MRYYIDSAAYFRRDETHGGFSLMSLATNEQLFFNRSCRLLFDHTDAWIDLDEITAKVNAPNVPRERIWNDYAKILYYLDAYDLARLEDLPPCEARSGCVRGQTEDYRAIARFVSDNADGSLSCAVADAKRYYSRQSVYRQIQNNLERFYLYLENGAVLALLTAAPSKRWLGGPVLNLISLVFDSGLDSDRADALLGEMLASADADAARMKMVKLRYEAASPRQNTVTELLSRQGFTESITLPGELENGLDLTLWDRKIES